MTWPAACVRFVDTAGVPTADPPARGRVLQHPARRARDRASGRGSARARGARGLHGRGQTDRHPGDGGRSGVPRGREQVGPGRGARPGRSSASARRWERRARLGAPDLGAHGDGGARLPERLLELRGRYAGGHPPPRSTGSCSRRRDERPGPVRYLPGRQVAAGPPSFVLFSGRPPDTAYRRFLENRPAAGPRSRGGPASACGSGPPDGRSSIVASRPCAPRAVRLLRCPHEGRGAAWLARLTGGRRSPVQIRPARRDEDRSEGADAMSRPDIPRRPGSLPS